MRLAHGKPIMTAGRSVALSAFVPVASQPASRNSRMAPAISGACVQCR